MPSQEKPFLNPLKLNLYYKDPLLIEYMTKYILNWLPKTKREYIILCIGTDRSTGDSLGPFVGSLLEDYSLINFEVFGNLHEPIHAMNLNDYLGTIYQQNKNPFIITVDAALGRKRSIGEIITGLGAIQPGAAFKKDLPFIGHIHLVGIVNLWGPVKHDLLQNTSLSFILDMAQKMAHVLLKIDQEVVNNSVY